MYVLVCIICIGAPDSPNFGNFEGFSVPQHIKSLHLAGLTDAVVSVQSSNNLELDLHGRWQYSNELPSRD